jgi:hypothetical protein
VWEDNESVLRIVNHDRPTPRSRHIVIHYFCLQQWCVLGELILIHIAGVVNPSDALTKAMGWTLHCRHCWFLMGYCGFCPHPTTHSSLQLLSQLGRESADLRRDTGLRNQNPGVLTLCILAGSRACTLTHTELSDSSSLTRSFDQSFPPHSFSPQTLTIAFTINV